MADQRRVGHSARRRMGASSSHLGQAGGPGGSWSPPYAQSPGGDAALSAAEQTAQGNVQVPIAGGRIMSSGGRAKGVPAEYPTATKPPLGDSGAFVSGVSSAVQGEPHPARPQVTESSGARLTVSPSMKVPTESPVPLQGGGRPVPSTPSRQGSFGQGQGEASWG